MHGGLTACGASLSALLGDQTLCAHREGLQNSISSQLLSDRTSPGKAYTPSLEVRLPWGHKDKAPSRHGPITSEHGVGEGSAGATWTLRQLSPWTPGESVLGT